MSQFDAFSMESTVRHQSYAIDPLITKVPLNQNLIFNLDKKRRKQLYLPLLINNKKKITTCVIFTTEWTSAC